MIQKEIFCGGRFITTQETLEMTAPYSGEPLAQTYLASVRELEDAITAGLKVKKMLKDLPSFRKTEILLFIAGRLQKERDDFARIICLEAAKPWKYAAAEVDRAIQVFVVAAEECKRLPREYLDLEWTPPGIGKEGLVKYFPAGLVAGISPFNFPLNLAVHKIAPAIAAGCPIILKPSSRTPLATLELARIIHDSGLPEGAVSILPMNRVTGNLLVTDDRISLLSFTGSPEVGWKMKASAGKKKVILELGGNAGVIVARTADPGLAVQKCLTGAFAYSGQVCIHTQRIFVHRSLFDQFSEDFISRAKLLRRGDPLSPDTGISVMISEEEAVRVEAWVNDAVHNGARILAGGTREGSFYHPTVLTGTSPDMNVCFSEIFGPVVTLEPYDDTEEAVNRVNEGRFGLQAGVFTNDIREMDFAFSHLEVGGVIINDVPTFRVDHMPYGGVKDSGLGREGVKYAIMDMLEPRLLVKNF